MIHIYSVTDTLGLYRLIRCQVRMYKMHVPQKRISFGFQCHVNCVVLFRKTGYFDVWLNSKNTNLTMGACSPHRVVARELGWVSSVKFSDAFGYRVGSDF